MKMTIEIECTPDEARQFMGLPDVKPLQQAMMQRMETQMTEAADRLTPDAMLRSWLALGPEQMREMFARFMRSLPRAKDD